MVQEQPGGEITSIWNKNFICVIIANFMLCFAHTSVNPLVASYTLFLGVNESHMGLLAGMFFGISLAMRPIAGPVTTKYDKRKLLIFVFALGSIASTGYALFHSVAAFVAFRFLNGVQYSLIGSLIMTLAGDNLPKERIASGMGIYGIGGAIGTAIAPAISSAILEFGTKTFSRDTGFTLVFAFAALILALAIIPGVIMSPDKKSKEQIASTGAWYKNIITVHALPMTLVLFLLMIPYSLYNTYVFEFGEAKNVLFPNGKFGEISAFYMALALTMAVSRPMSGVLTDKFGARKVMYPALVLFAASLIIFGNSKSLYVVLLAAVLGAIGYGAAQPSLQAMAIQTETPARRGVASNTIYIGIDLALFTGPILGNIVYVKSNDYSVMFKSAVVPICIAAVCFAVAVPIFRRRVAALKDVQ